MSYNPRLHGKAIPRAAKGSSAVPALTRTIADARENAAAALHARRQVTHDGVTVTEHFLARMDTSGHRVCSVGVTYTAVSGGGFVRVDGEDIVLSALKQPVTVDANCVHEVLADPIQSVTYLVAHKAAAQWEQKTPPAVAPVRVMEDAKRDPDANKKAREQSILEAARKGRAPLPVRGREISAVALEPVASTEQLAGSAAIGANLRLVIPSDDD